MRDPITILGTLLQQMIESLPYGSETPLNLDKDVHLHVREMARIPDVIISIAASFPRVYIVLDGLDECDEESRRRLLPFLKTLKAHIPVMIVCRDIQEIRGRFMGKRLHIPIRAQDVQADIIKYLRRMVCVFDCPPDPPGHPSYVGRPPASFPPAPLLGHPPAPLLGRPPAPLLGHPPLGYPPSLSPHYLRSLPPGPPLGYRHLFYSDDRLILPTKSESDEIIDELAVRANGM